MFRYSNWSIIFSIENRMDLHELSDQNWNCTHIINNRKQKEKMQIFFTFIFYLKSIQIVILLISVSIVFYSNRQMAIEHLLFRLTNDHSWCVARRPAHTNSPIYCQPNHNVSGLLFYFIFISANFYSAFVWDWVNVFPLNVFLDGFMFDNMIARSRSLSNSLSFFFVSFAYSCLFLLYFWHSILYLAATKKLRDTWWLQVKQSEARENTRGWMQNAMNCNYVWPGKMLACLWLLLLLLAGASGVWVGLSMYQCYSNQPTSQPPSNQISQPVNKQPEQKIIGIRLSRSKTMHKQH